MRWGRIYIVPTESTLAVLPACLQGAWHARSLQSKYAAAASSASRVRRWHRACTMEARLSRSRSALNLHLPAVQTVLATHIGGAPPCAARTCLLRSCRRRSARSSYCTLFNNRCMLSACSLHAPASLKTRTGDVRRRYGSLRFGYWILRRPAAERCTADCDRGLSCVAMGCVACYRVNISKTRHGVHHQSIDERAVAWANSINSQWFQ